MSCRQNCCSRPKIAICARERAHTFFELYNPNYVGTQLKVLTIKIYIYIIYNIDYIDYIYIYIYIDCSVYTVQCKAYNNTIHPRSIYIVAAHTHTYIVDMQIFYPLVYLPAHIYCGYANILSISVLTRAHILWI